VNISANTDVISFGFYKGKGFWSFNVGARADVDATIPKTMFDYLRATDADNFSWSGESFDIRNEKLRLNAYIEVGAGYSRAINERLTVGGKAKLLLGAGSINLNINQLYMYGKDAGIDSEFQLKTDAYLEASAKGLDLEEENGNPFRLCTRLLKEWMKTGGERLTFQIHRNLLADLSVTGQNQMFGIRGFLMKDELYKSFIEELYSRLDKDRYPTTIETLCYVVDMAMMVLIKSMAMYYQDPSEKENIIQILTEEMAILERGMCNTLSHSNQRMAKL